MVNHFIEQLDEIPPVKCPCGLARRAFASLDDSPVTVHLTDIMENSQVHYHRKITEIYTILEGEGSMELDGELIPVRPLMTVQIRPGCRHRAVGRMRVHIVALPAFDPADEWFD